MQLQIQSPNIITQEKLLIFIRKKFRGLEKLYNRIEKCTITLKEEKDDHNQKCSITVRLSVPGKDLVAVEKARDFETAVQMVLTDLKNEIRRHKEKMQEQRF